jgi:hypothetical protein
MTSLRRILAGAAGLVCVAGLANASVIEAFTTSFPISGPNPNTDFPYTLTLPKFNVAGATLTGATIYLYAAENISEVEIANLGTIAQTSFSVTATSTIAGGSPATPLNDSATGGTIFTAGGGLVLQLYSQSFAIIGGNGNPACAPNTTPTSSCSSVVYNTGFVDNILNDPNGLPGQPTPNTQLGAYSITTGVGGVTGLTSNVSAGLLGDYTGAGTFSLTGGTYGNVNIGGGGSVSGTVIGTGMLEAEIDYTYVIPSGTPEPTTMALMGGALLGLGLLGKRFKKS